MLYGIPYSARKDLILLNIGLSLRDEIDFKDNLAYIFG